MSCEVKSYCNIPDLKKVQELLGFSQDENWLNAVYYSISPTGEIIAFGHGSKFIILSSHWSNVNNQLPFYSITWKGELENPNDIITAIITLPVYGPNVTSGAEWTCIALGLSSGLVLFYSDSGLQIFSQRWHQEPVQSLKAQSGFGLNEEIYVGYLSCVCVLQANQLFQTLKGLKQHLSKQVTTIINGSSNINSSNGGGSRTNLSQFPDIIPCRKWEYRNRISIINDSVVVGTQKSCTFDHLLEHSLEKGFYAKCRSSPPQNSLVLGVGVKPYVGFYYAKEGFVQADFGDVAKAVANKVISSLPTWLFKSSNSNAQQKSQDEAQQIPAGEPMNCRFGICDIQRQAINVYLSPDHNLAVVTDNLNRIILIDCNRGVALRIWKGYRDAQCSFIRAKEKTMAVSNKKSSSNENERRKALFLIIYAPRRSCLEIWALQHGPKVAAFTVCKNGQLIYNTHGLIGVTPGVKLKTTLTNMCLFFDPSDETIKEVCVPFHCALSEANSKTAKDIHLLRRLKLYLRGTGIGGTSTNNEDDIISDIETTCLNLQTDEIRLQCLDMLAKNKKVLPNMFLKAILALNQSLKTEEDAVMTLSTTTTTAATETEVSANEIEHQENIRKLLHTELENYSKLVEFYIAIKNQQHPIISNISDDTNSLPPQCNNEKLSLSENDLETLQKLLDLNQTQQQESPTNNNCVTKVTFKDKHNEEEDFIEFLNAFSIDTKTIQLKSKPDLYGSVGRNIFNRFLEKGHNLQIFIENSEKSSISSEDFILLILSYWLEKPFTYSKSDELIEDLTRLASIIQHISDLAGSKIQYEYNSICPWWQNIREMLLESSCALRGLLAAVVCRNISLQQQRRNSSPDENIVNEDDVWEQVSQEAAQWSLLTGKLEDISILGAILSYPISSVKIEMPIIAYEKPDCSLKSILCGGKGIAAELVAKWLTHSGIHPKKIIELGNEITTTTTTTTTTITTTTTATTKINDDNEKDDEIILKHLKHLREHFPFSLESGILLCQMTWEYMCYWSKNLSKLEYFRAGLTCLESFRCQDYRLKHGLCCMIWNAHIKIPLEATKKLINRVGKLPKEKLCQQDIGISVSIVPDFLELCLNFFKHFTTSLNYDIINKNEELKFEEILQDGQVPLPYLTLQQNHAIQDLLHLHIQLCKVLHLIAFFSLKITKPCTTLFDAMSNQAFFIEINRELPYKLPPADLVLQKQRQEFLCKSVTASMDLIREDLERLYVLEHTKYMEQIEELADLWELDKTPIKRHQVVEMYAHGWDAYAEELLEAIIDKEEIGQLLLEIAGRRLNLFVSTSSTAFCQVASVGSLLLNYLDNLKGKTDGIQIMGTSDDIELEPLTNLTAKAFQCLSTKESKSLHIAGQMFDACSLLKAANKSSTIN